MLLTEIHCAKMGFFGMFSISCFSVALANRFYKAKAIQQTINFGWDMDNVSKVNLEFINPYEQSVNFQHVCTLTPSQIYKL